MIENGISSHVKIILIIELDEKCYRNEEFFSSEGKFLKFEEGDLSATKPISMSGNRSMYRRGIEHDTGLTERKNNAPLPIFIYYPTNRRISAEGVSNVLLRNNGMQRQNLFPTNQIRLPQLRNHLPLLIFPTRPPIHRFAIAAGILDSSQRSV
jgi:hypothetical protein